MFICLDTWPNVHIISFFHYLHISYNHKKYLNKKQLLEKIDVTQRKDITVNKNKWLKSNHRSKDV